jgi:hypothetical protein
MSSSVNVNNTNELAKKNILQGGTLNYNNNINDVSLKSGLGGNNNAYTNNPSNPYQRGIRPMPGITSVDIKSKSAYGSLREVIVNFQCWDIQQLEDLELLYMRPGYTVLIEWGWTPYLDNSGTYRSNFIDYYDIINKPQTNRTQIFKDLYKKSNDYGGNYDAMFGYVKNYQWSARPDGGYDCQTTVISTGELIESIKVNYVLPQIIEKSENGILNNQFTSPGKDIYWLNKYQKNKLAGIWAEAYYKIREVETSTTLSYSNNSIFKNSISVNLPYAKSINISSEDSLSIGSDYQVYITLETFFEVLNKYVILKSSGDNQTLVSCSLYSNSYETGSNTNPNQPLLCIAHPLQVSVDPSVCLIKSPLWSNKKDSIIVKAEEVAKTDPNFNNARAIVDLIKKGDSNSIVKGIEKIEKIEVYNLVNEFIKKENYKDLQDFLNINLRNVNSKTGQDIKNHLEKILNIPTQIILQRDPNKIDSIIIKYSSSNNTLGGSQSTIIEGSRQAISNLSFLDRLKQPFFYNNQYSEIGEIRNIYVNVDFLYKKALDINLESQDKKEKNEINLYNYIKSIILSIQSSIGNINNFEIHVDPIDSVARIIDVNYTEPNKALYDTLFELQVHNLQSVVRSYSLQSQIFPEQSSMIAIGAQVKGGQLGTQTNTMIDFNRSITDRIIPKKEESGNNEATVNNNSTSISALASIIKAFESLSYDPIKNPNQNDKIQSSDLNTLFSTAKNGLRDLIAYFQSVTSAPGSNRNLIPTKFSFEMDGIGGLVIGHMFKLPANILPKGYRGQGAGVELGNAITSIGHTISNGDWVTKVDSLNIVLSNNNTKINFKDLDLNKILSTTLNPLTETLSPGFNNPNANNLEKYVTENNIASVKKNQLNSGGEIEQGISAIAGSVLSTIKQRYPDIKLEITGGNDVFHQNLKQFSNHKVGKAIDFTINPATNDNINKVKSVLEEFKKMNNEFKYVDEYNNPTKHATGKHFHISFNTITKGA